MFTTSWCLFIIIGDSTWRLIVGVAKAAAAGASLGRNFGLLIRYWACNITLMRAAADPLCSAGADAGRLSGHDALLSLPAPKPTLGSESFVARMAPT